MGDCQSYHVYDLLKGDSKRKDQGLRFIQDRPILSFIIIEEMFQQHFLIRTAVDVCTNLGIFGEMA